MEETVGNIKGGATPALQRERVSEDLAGALHPLDDIRVRTRVASRDWWASRQVVSQNQKLLLIQYPIRHSLGALGIQQLLETVRPVTGDWREPGRVVELVALPLLDHDVADVFEHLGGPVLALVQLEQLRSLVDELGVALAGDKGRVLENVGDEGDVRLDAPDMDLIDGPSRLAADTGEVLSRW